MSKSETRHRSRTLSVRFSPDEYAQLEAAAERAGLSVGGWLRQAVLNAPPPRQSRRPPVERQLLALAVRMLGKIGSNVNQLARQANSGNAPDIAELRAACLAVIEGRNALLRALGVSEAAPPPTPAEGEAPRP